MADHDRNVGSRGVEEAPRVPTPSEGAGGFPRRPEERLSYGEVLEEPAPRSGYRRDQDTMPNIPGPNIPGPGFPGAGAAGPGAWERGSGFRDFFRQKQTQIIGAGLIGLVVGGLLGGGAVLFVSSVADRHPMPDLHWEVPPGWGPGRDHAPSDIVSSCRPGPDGVRCVLPRPVEEPRPISTIPAWPEPTRTG